MDDEILAYQSKDELAADDLDDIDEDALLELEEDDDDDNQSHETNKTADNAATDTEEANQPMVEYVDEEGNPVEVADPTLYEFVKYIPESGEAGIDSSDVEAANPESLNEAHIQPDENKTPLLSPVSGELPQQGGEEPDSTVDSTVPPEDQELASGPASFVGLEESDEEEPSADREGKEGGSSQREKFVSERSNIIKLVPSNVRKDIPDNLEAYITAEDAARVEAFLTKDRERKSMYRTRRGGYHANRTLNRPPSHNQHSANQRVQRHEVISQSAQIPAAPKKILINPHFRGNRPSLSTLPPYIAGPFPPGPPGPEFCQPPPILSPPSGTFSQPPPSPFQGMFARPPPLLPLPPHRLPPDFTRPPPGMVIVKQQQAPSPALAPFSRPPPPIQRTALQTTVIPPNLQPWKQGPPPPLLPTPFPSQPPHPQLVATPNLSNLPCQPPQMGLVSAASYALSSPLPGAPLHPSAQQIPFITLGGSNKRDYSNRLRSPPSRDYNRHRRYQRSCSPRSRSRSPRGAPPKKSHHSEMKTNSRKESNDRAIIKEVPIVENAPTPEEEDAQMRDLRQKLEEQKRLREEILRRKEERRRQMVLQRLKEQDGKAVTDLDGKQPSAKKAAVNTSNAPTSREQATEGQKKKIILLKKKHVDADEKAISKGGASSVRVADQKQASTSEGSRQTVCLARRPFHQVSSSSSQPASHGPTKSTAPSQKEIKLDLSAKEKPSTTSFRTVLPPGQKVKPGPVVMVENLAASTSRIQLLKLARGVGPVESLNLITKEKKAIIKFKDVKTAALFQKKYQRHMLDLSLIQITFQTT